MGGEWATGAALVSESFPAQPSRQGAGVRAELVGDRLRPRRARQPDRDADLGMARRVLRRRRCRRCSRSGSGARRGAGDLAATPTSADRGRISALFAPGIAPAHRLHHADERVHALRLVGAEHAGCRRTCACRRRSGGIGLSSSTMSLFVIAMQVGMWFGYVSFGFIADAIGRKRTYIVFVLAASVLLPLYGVPARARRSCSCSGPLVAFFGTGYFSGFGAVDRRAVSDGRARDRRGRLLQHRPHRQRRRAVRGRIAGVARAASARRSRVTGCRVPARRARVDRDSRTEQPRADVSGPLG